MKPCKKLASHHILRRNRLIDNLIHQFSPEDKNLPTENASCVHFCKHMQRCSETMKECDSLESLDELLGTMESFIYASKIEVHARIDVLSIKIRHPKEDTFLCRCKKTNDSIKHLRESLRRVPNEMPKKFHPDATKCDLKKDKDKYVVYFNASSSECSGWLNNSPDVWDFVCFEHFMNFATEFDTYEEAESAANERLKKIEEVVVASAAKPPSAFDGNQPSKSVAERISVYKYFILKKTGTKS